MFDPRSLLGGRGQSATISDVSANANGFFAVGSVAVPVVVLDTVGAGDAFAAGLAFGITAGWGVERVLELASRLASLIASRHGAIPGWDPSELGMDIPGTPSPSRG
jgi:sugar/nucleoside kinase (ribokinase family)